MIFYKGKVCMKVGERVTKYQSIEQKLMQDLAENINLSKDEMTVIERVLEKRL